MPRGGAASWSKEGQRPFPPLRARKRALRVRLPIPGVQGQPVKRHGTRGAAAPAQRTTAPPHRDQMPLARSTLETNKPGRTCPSLSRGAVPSAPGQPASTSSATSGEHRFIGPARGRGGSLQNVRRFWVPAARALRPPRPARPCRKLITWVIKQGPQKSGGGGHCARHTKP